MRADAERNRQSLIAAASDMMRSEGDDVPMELIAERAKLTRGTLYRNFPHRQAMYEAVLAHDLETMTARIARSCEDDPLAFIREATELMMVYDKFLISLASMPDYDAKKNERSMVDVIATPLEAAQAQGLLDPALTGGDILMACRMLSSHWRLDDEPDLGSVFKRRFALLLRGLSPTCRRPWAASSADPNASHDRQERNLLTGDAPLRDLAPPMRTMNLPGPV